jgi:hypothetical protein
MREYIQNAEKKPQTPQESLEFRKQVEDHVIDRDITVLKGEKQLQKGFWETLGLVE